MSRSFCYLGRKVYHQHSLRLWDFVLAAMTVSWALQNYRLFSLTNPLWTSKKRRELTLREEEVSCLRRSGLLVIWTNWNLSQKVGLKSLIDTLFPQVQETMQSFNHSQNSLQILFTFFFSFFEGRRKCRGFFLCPQNSLLWKAALWC